MRNKANMRLCLSPMRYSVRSYLSYLRMYHFEKLNQNAITLTISVAHFFHARVKEQNMSTTKSASS
jgi:predicted glycosyltransferase involved in capsule biosynthesis